MPKKAGNFDEKLANLLTFLGVFNLIAIVLIIVANIILRFVFNYPLMWSIELCAVMVVWMTFIVMGVNHRENRHFRIDAIAMMLSAKLQRIFAVLSNILTFVCLLLLLYSVMESIIVNRSMTLTAIEVSVAYALYLPLLIGALTYLYFIFRPSAVDKTSQGGVQL